MSSRSALSLSTRTVKIYSGANDAQARADIAEHIADLANPHQVTAAQVGLGNADNTSDANKPVSTAQAAALALKAPLANPALSGIPTAPTAAPGTASVQLATTAFVQAALTAIDVPGVGDDLAVHIADHANPHAVSKSQVGLPAVDNTADAAKPVSGPQQAAINVATAAAAAAQADIDAHEASTTNPHGVTKAQVGLGSVDNTADLAKPISTATQSALNAAAGATATVATNLATHTSNTNNPHAVTADDVGLGNVDNTADADKPVSDATQIAINAAVGDTGTVAADLAAHVANTSNPHAVDKSDVGLGSVDNTADAAKPVSAAQQTALNLKANIASPALTGVPTAPTAPPLTNGTQLATTAYADAAAGVAIGAADDAAADAGEAIAAAAQVPSLVAGVPGRPGDAVGLFGATKTGAPNTVALLDPAWVVTTTAGRVVRVITPPAADPQTIAPAAAYPVEPGRVYEVRWRVQRHLNPADPLVDSVTVGVQWLTNAKAANGASVIENIPLVQANGVVERSARIGITPVAAADLDYVAPAGTVYFRPYCDVYGDATAQTDVVTIAAQDVTAAYQHQAVQVVTPAEGITIAMADLRPLFVNKASMAALTILLPPNVVSGDIAELGFLAPVDSLTVKTSTGGAIPTAPTSAYGPGAAIHMRYISDVVGWVLWK